MEAKAAIKRKNIDLPVDILQKLSVMAENHGKSLKAYIEGILIKEANTPSERGTENPSSSNDSWWNNPNNVAEVNEGIAQYKAGMGQVYTIEEIKDKLGL